VLVVAGIQDAAQRERIIADTLKYFPKILDEANALAAEIFGSPLNETSTELSQAIGWLTMAGGGGIWIIGMLCRAFAYPNASEALGRGINNNALKCLTMKSVCNSILWFAIDS
jgi:hypothetical protein